MFPVPARIRQGLALLPIALVVAAVARGCGH